MRQLVRFLRDEAGFVTGPEWAFVTTLLVLGAITAALALPSPSAEKADLPTVPCPE